MCSCTRPVLGRESIEVEVRSTRAITYKKYVDFGEVMLCKIESGNVQDRYAASVQCRNILLLGMFRDKFR